MKQLLDILITAEFNGTLTHDRSSRCVVGEVIYNALGFRVGSESWLPIIEAERMGIIVIDSLLSLKQQLERGLQHLSISIDDLVRLDEANMLHDIESVIEMVECWNQIPISAV